MGKIAGYALVPVDGVNAGPAGRGFLRRRDEAYVCGGRGVVRATEAMMVALADLGTHGTRAGPSA